ncbi:zinc finger protein 551-like [Homalodisca vitripennis]|uniref:zinc finger protein 551-like n=1 Tax=Homalodisca vitripennis TaxID=197043 RepID=UPI001EEACD43|nr:zinc finger protein 551-like [Homalodisca vitripennis]KAG8308282.1 hypothetical protein J6590_002371 [Homalodisca vitripennis]
MLDLLRYRCGCGKSYVQKQTLQRHQRLECGREPQYPCLRCGKRSRHKSDLVSHIRHVHKLPEPQILQELSLCNIDYVKRSKRPTLQLLSVE